MSTYKKERGAAMIKHMVILLATVKGLYGLISKWC